MFFKNKLLEKISLTSQNFGKENILINKGSPLFVIGIMNENNFNVYYELARNNYQGVVNPSVYFANQKRQFKFSLDGKYSSSDRQNMSFAEFSQRIMKTFNAEVK